jgi:hypothetical protein
LKKQIAAHIIVEEMKAIIQTRPELRSKPATIGITDKVVWVASA